MADPNNIPTDVADPWADVLLLANDGADELRPTDPWADMVHLTDPWADELQLADPWANMVHPTDPWADVLHPTDDGADAFPLLADSCAAANHGTNILQSPDGSDADTYQSWRLLGPRCVRSLILGTYDDFRGYY